MKPKQDGDIDLVSDKADEVRVPVSVRPILAYQVVSRDAFVSPATRKLKTETISRQEAVRMKVITSVGDALGAITRQDIPAGRYLRHSDLLKGPPQRETEAPAELVSPDRLDVSAPQERRSPVEHRTLVYTQQPDSAAVAPSATAVGDRPAITTFIPAHRTAFAIPLNRIFGAEDLQIGDAIDLLARYALKRLRNEDEMEKCPDGCWAV